MYFNMLVCLSWFLLWRNAYSCLLPFFFLIVVKFESYSDIPDSRPSSNIRLANIFFYSVYCLFTFLIMSFWCIYLKNSDEVWFVYFFLLLHMLFVTISKNTLQNSRSWNFNLRISSESFIVLFLIFKWLIYFK